MQRSRPKPRAPLPARRRDRPWSSVPWWHSLLFITGLLLLITTLVIKPGSEASDPKTKTVLYRVTDLTTGEPLAGVTVSVGGQTLATGLDGTVELPVSQTNQEVIVQRSGYNTYSSSASTDSPDEQDVAMAPEPSPTATEVPPTEIPPTEVPPTEVPLAEGEDFRGVVSDSDGNPIVGAVVRIKSDWVETSEEGRFRIANPDNSSKAFVSASGFADLTVPLTVDPEITLERFIIKGVYLRGMPASDPAVVDDIIDLINQTELNAVVIDIKDGIVFYDSQIEFFRDVGAVQPQFDAEALVQQFHEHGIYVIARLVAFKDPLVAEAHPELAIQDEETGEPWLGWAGEPWVNPLKKGLYKPNVDMAVEAARLGFDEIQYDYVRFPDGDLSGADFGEDYNDPDKRIGAVTTLLSMTMEKLRPRGVKLSADIFGWMLLVDDDQGIGQRMQDVTAVVDYVSPMIYPSHFPEGSIAVDGHPNDFPYETISISLSLGMAKIPGAELKMRPWLQDFTLPGQTEYGGPEIRAEIDATEDSGASGWLVWNIDANYVFEAYKLADE